MRTYTERFFENYLITKQYVLINLTLNPMGEVNLLIDNNIRNDEFEKKLLVKKCRKYN